MGDANRRADPGKGERSHRWVTTGNGAPLVLERPTDIDCTTCANGKLWVINEDPLNPTPDVEVHCQHCDNRMTLKQSQVPRRLVPAGERPAQGGSWAGGMPASIWRQHLAGTAVAAPAPSAPTYPPHMVAGVFDPTTGTFTPNAGQTIQVAQPQTQMPAPPARGLPSGPPPRSRR
jgi:hypothetical protein